MRITRPESIGGRTPSFIATSPAHPIARNIGSFIRRDRLPVNATEKASTQMAESKHGIACVEHLAIRLRSITPHKRDHLLSRVSYIAITTHDRFAHIRMQIDSLTYVFPDRIGKRGVVRSPNIRRAHGEPMRRRSPLQKQALGERLCLPIHRVWPIIKHRSGAVLRADHELSGNINQRAEVAVAINYIKQVLRSLVD